MFIFLSLLSSIAVVALSTGGRTAQDCTIGEQWTENFIRFECYQGTGLVVKGVRAIGCVPTNTASGSIIPSGSTFDEKYFTYSCTKNGDVFAYQIINCRDSTGKVLAVGEERKMTDESTWKCYKDEKGAIKLSQEKPGGCLYNGTTYMVGQAWTQNIDFKATVAGVEQIIGKAIRMQCKSAGVQGSVGQATGCVTTSGLTLSNGGFATVNSLYVKCMIDSKGSVTMNVIDESDVTCSLDGETFKNGEKYTTPDGVSLYTCVYGVMKKQGCMIDGKRYSLGSLVNVNGSIVRCNNGAGAFDFGNITGCTLPDGSFKKFESTWVNGTEVYRCYYKIKGASITPYYYFYGCSYKSKAIDRNKIVKYGDELKKCAVDGSVYKMRDLSTAEYTAYIESQSIGGSSNVFGGSGGSGAGGDLTAKPTTSTTTQPTKTTRTATNEKSATSIRAIEHVTSTTGRPSTKPPSSTTISDRSTRTTIASSSPTELPITREPTTTINGQCHDLFEMCSTLAPICHSRFNSTMKIIRTMNITVEQIKEIFDLLGIDQPTTSSEEEKEEMDEVIRGLTGFESEEEQDCGCRDDPCVSRCQRRRKPSCKKCQIFKRKVRELVLMVCPATCGSCDAVGKVPAIIKALLRFYTHDCR